VKAICCIRATGDAEEWIAQQITEAFPWNEVPSATTIKSTVLPSRGGYEPRGSVTSLLPHLAVAELLRGAIDRVDPSRVPGSRRRVERGASAPDAAILCALLQRNQNARSLNKDAPCLAQFKPIGHIMSHALLGGLHHQYVQI
jgi:hypothetical protein